MSLFLMKYIKKKIESGALSKCAMCVCVCVGGWKEVTYSENGGIELGNVTFPGPDLDINLSKR